MTWTKKVEHLRLHDLEVLTEEPVIQATIGSTIIIFGGEVIEAEPDVATKEGESQEILTLPTINPLNVSLCYCMLHQLRSSYLHIIAIVSNFTMSSNAYCNIQLFFSSQYATFVSHIVKFHNCKYVTFYQ